MKTLLVPIDFSDKSRQALDFAIQLNGLVKNGKIVLLHVLDYPSSSFNSTGEVPSSETSTIYQGEFIKGVKKRLAEWSQSVIDAGYEVITKMKYGHPYVEISSEIADEDVDLIVMGSDGSSGLHEIFVGSVAEKVIRNAKCPVFTVKGGVSLSSMKNMVFATGLSENEDTIATQVKKVQKLLNLKMHVLRVKTPRNFLTEQEAQKQLRAFAERNHFEDYTLQTIEAEFVDEGVVSFAEKIQSGLIAIGTHGKTGLAHIIGGSKAEDVANESKIPVLTFRIDS